MQTSFPVSTSSQTLSIAVKAPKRLVTFTARTCGLLSTFGSLWLRVSTASTQLGQGPTGTRCCSGSPFLRAMGLGACDR